MDFSSSTLVTIISIISAALFYLYRLVRWHRIEQLKAYPRLKPHLIWGHLKWVGNTLKYLPKNAHKGT
jgi:hypothetical protein